MVPVGGSIIYSPVRKDGLVQAVNSNYPGQASSGPITDLFITLLSMGEAGLKELLKTRKQTYYTLKKKMEEVALRYGERVLDIRDNRISIACTLNGFQRLGKRGEEDATFFGSYLFSRRGSGIRVVKADDKGKLLCGK